MIVGTRCDGRHRLVHPRIFRGLQTSLLPHPRSKDPSLENQLDYSTVRHTGSWNRKDISGFSNTAAHGEKHLAEAVSLLHHGLQLCRFLSSYLRDICPVSACGRTVGPEHQGQVLESWCANFHFHLFREYVLRECNCSIMTRIMLRDAGRLFSLHGFGACSAASHYHLGPPDGSTKEGWLVYDPWTGSVVSDCSEDSVIEERSMTYQLQRLHLRLHQDI